jgi:hypothetical protein
MDQVSQKSKDNNSMQSAFRQTGLSNRTASNTAGGSGSQKSKILNCGLSTFSTTY